ncbi:MAG: DNA primase [Candidatus Nomurabacteria bacterium]|nr:MAG: DNA primase [Candidatus Nomurabacteria bacterium]HRV76226.1 DNA primase [Candidatus Saccharimonadales bacterium]
MESKEEIKQRLPIEVVIGEYVELKRAGRNYKGLSPFSAEKTPSFIVSPEKNIWHDFSSGKGGDVFSFVMEVEGLEFPEALKHLAQKAGIELQEYNSKDRKEGQLKQRIVKINELATKYYQTSLLKNPTALEYLKQRGVTKQGIKDFKLGYAPNSPNGLVNLLQKHGFTSEEILKAGIATKRGSRPGQLYDIFRERIMFPFVSPNGEHLGFTARLIKSNGFGPKYMNTPQTIVYNKSNFLYGLNIAKESVRKKDQIVLLEGNLDVISSSQAGVKEIVAASGTAVTPLQLRQVQRLTENLIFCLDTDKAGIDATIRSLEIAASTDLKVTVASIPIEYKDPDELIKAEGVERWELALQSTQDAYIWLIETLSRDLDLKSPTQKGAYAKSVIKILNLIKNPVSQESYKKYLSDKLEVSIDSLDKLAENAPLKRYKEIKTNPNIKISPTYNRLKLVTDRFLSLLLTCEDNSSLNTLKKHLKASSMPTEPSKQAYRLLIEPSKENKVNKTDPELIEYLSKLELINSQLLELSAEDTNQIDLLDEQYKQFQQASKNYQIEKLKQELKTADQTQQAKLLKKIHRIQSAPEIQLKNLEYN